MVITGFIIGIVAIVEMATYAKTNRMGYWPAINILAGIWLFISTGIVAMNVALVWSNIVLGVLAIVTALVALSYERMHVTHEVQPPTRTHLRT
jgi:4-hydroxybenzoate polyprenyltransferase